MLADDGCSSFQGTHGPGADSSTATPDFPDITKASGETDWGKYLAYMEDDMSFEERINNNMLLEGSSIREISANQSLTQLSLDLERDYGRMMLLFKDLPAMRQGKQVGQAMYILGYDLARPDFFLRLFEKLPSTISLLPQHWDFSIEILRLTVGDVLDMLEDNDVVNLSTLHQCILPWWDEELGFKVVILILFGQWILDFDRAFIWEEETKMLRELLVKWRVLLSAGMDGQKEFAHDVEEEVEERQSHVEEGDTKGAQEVAAQDVSKESSLVSHSPEASHISSLVDDGIPQHAPPSLKVPRHRQKDTYDSDEEDEWAALEKWAASKKQESPLKAVNPEQVSETALVAPELSADDNIDPTNAFLTPERVKSPLEIFDLENPADAKRFSDLSTLCDGCEGNKEKLTFSNTLRNAMLSAGSIEAMTEVYLDFVRKNPEHDSERKRIELLEFLLGHVEEKDGGLLSVEKMLEELKDMGLTEDEAEAAEAERGGSSNRSGKRVSWPCPDCLATPLEDGT